MIIDRKIVYIKKKEVFESLLPTIPVGLNPVIFIEDTREMWTCGTYFSIGYPGIEVSEESGSVKVEIGNSFFMFSTVGESLSIRSGTGNRIILSSNALNKVDTDAPLFWNIADRKLVHLASGVMPGSYGQSTNLSNASVFMVSNIMIDSTGHITYAENHNIEIRDYVDQLAPSSLQGERNVLLAYNEDSTNMDTSQTRKANGMTFNDATKRLTVTGGLTSNGPAFINHGDLSVIDGFIIGNLKGDVTGQATPKIHISLKPEYGGASTMLYGHVKLQDLLTVKPNPSSTNENINDTNIINAIAASPLMVWNAIDTAKSYADSLLSSNNAMLYKGAIEAGISSPGAFTPAAEVGNTYVVTFGTNSYVNSVGYINGELVEIGDLLICKEATAEATNSNWAQIRNKWTFVQTNTTGVVSGPSSSSIGQLAVFNSVTGKLIKGLSNGNVGQVLTISNAGIPVWSTSVSQTWRGINYKNIDQVVKQALNNEPSSGDITFGASGNMRLVWDKDSKTLTFITVSDNSWRPILAYTVSSTIPLSIDENSDLTFSSDFLWIDNQLTVGWASVDISGNITYHR